MNRSDQNSVVRCLTCGLNHKTPDIIINSDGVCNFCKKYQQEYKNLNSGKQKAFLALIERYRGNGEYDAVMLFSGGKDSTYVLSQLVIELKLKILAITFDNWFLSNETLLNQKKVLAGIGVDQILVRPNYHSIKKIFETSISILQEGKAANYFPNFGALCWPCFTMIYLHAAKIAREKNINLLIGGWSPGQIDAGRHNIMEDKKISLQNVMDIFVKPFQEVVADRYDFSPNFTNLSYDNMYLLPFFDFFRYREKHILYYITSKLHWICPSDTDGCSTNCVLNSLDRLLIRKHFGFDRYTLQAANMVRKGLLDRQKVIDIDVEELITQKVFDQLQDLDLTIDGRQ